MSIQEFAKYLEKLEKTTSRNEMTAILANLFKSLKPAEARVAVYLALGKLTPAYLGKELQIGEKLLMRAISKAYGIDLKEIEAKYKNYGDLGEVAFNVCLKIRNSVNKTANKNFFDSLTINEVYEMLFKISEISGEGAVENKINAFADLLKKLDPLSAKFITRIPLGALRLGFSDATILDALSFLSVGDKSLRKKVERAYNISADIGFITEKFLHFGIEGLKKIQINVGIPIRMAGAERLPNAQKIIEKLGTCAVEPKYDGFRLQIHLKKELQNTSHKDYSKKSDDLYKVAIYSRNLENVSAMFPDVAAATKKIGYEIIFEGEAIGYNPDSGEFLPFQETIQRKRKHNIDLFSKNIPLKVFVYDLLYLNGKNILELPYKKRREIMEKIFPQENKDTEIVLTKMDLVSDAKTLENKFEEYVSEGLEGVVVKKLEAPYQAGARGYHWVKYKRAMKGELADTIDCVVMGYYIGRGKRSDFGIGAILVGVFDEKSESFKTVAKIGTGFSDEEWREMKKRIDAIKTKEKPIEYDVSKELIPDIWARPEIVIEVQADEITKSPLHLAARDHFQETGLALRFPRMVKWRDDKHPQQATTVKELLKLYKMQLEK